MKAKQTKWYRGNKFTILPRLDVKKANEHRASHFVFEWLFLKVWSLDSFAFEVAAVCDGHWGLGFTAIIPRLRIVFAIPCPEILATWAQRKLWRRP